MLDKAYVLPDGRKVFKTEDGTRVFDEHGEEVKDFDPKTIEDWRPRHEGYQAIVDQVGALTKERDDLVEFQGELDDARERANEDGLTKGELDELEKRLEENAPDAVKRKLATETPALDSELRVAPKAEATFRPAGKLDMPTL